MDSRCVVIGNSCAGAFEVITKAYAGCRVILQWRCRADAGLFGSDLSQYLRRTWKKSCILSVQRHTERLANLFGDLEWLDLFCTPRKEPFALLVKKETFEKYRQAPLENCHSVLVICSSFNPNSFCHLLSYFSPIASFPHNAFLSLRLGAFPEGSQVGRRSSTARTCSIERQDGEILCFVTIWTKWKLYSILLYSIPFLSFPFYSNLIYLYIYII